MLNGSDPDHDECFVGPDLGPNYLQRLLADDKMLLASEELKEHTAYLLKGNKKSYSHRIGGNRKR